MSLIASVGSSLITAGIWVCATVLVVLMTFILIEELRQRMGARTRLHQDVLKAERQIHDLAVAAFAEMLDEARFGQIVSDETDDDHETAGELWP